VTFVEGAGITETSTTAPDGVRQCPIR